MAKKPKAGSRAGRSRRGRGENNTEANANQVEVRTAFSQGDLQLPAPNDYQHHKKALLGAQDKLRTANSLVRTCRKNALAAGVDPDSVFEANRIVRDNDPKKTANKLNQLAFALEQEGFSIHITVHDTLAGDELDTIYRRFYADGKAGKTLDNRYPENSDLALQADRAWRHGTAANLTPPISPEDADKALDDDELLEKLAKLPAPPDMSQAALN